MNVKIEGLGKLDRKLKRLADSASPRQLRLALEDAAEPIASAARSNAPKLTGMLSREINIKTLNTGAAVAVTPGDAFWGFFQEMGTVNQPAQPWLLPAFFTHKRQAVKRFGDRLQRELLKEAI